MSIISKRRGILQLVFPDIFFVASGNRQDLMELGLLIGRDEITLFEHFYRLSVPVGHLTKKLKKYDDFNWSFPLPLKNTFLQSSNL
jgi:hypothetical protein